MSIVALGPAAPEGAPLTAAQLETPSTFAPVFEYLSAEKIDHILTRIAYDIDWESKGKVTINVIAKVSKTHAQIVGYLPAANVSLGACRLSAGLLRLSLAVASLGACRMFGIASPSSFHDVLNSAATVRQGVIDVLPLGFGLGAYLANYAPSLDLFVTDLKVSRDKWGVISEFCEQTKVAAFKDDDEKYQEYKPWAKDLALACEKTYMFATEGAECMVTCAAWGDLVLGLGALVASPYMGGSSLPYALTSLARGALALGASTLIDLASEYDLKGKIVSIIMPEDPEAQFNIDASLDRLVWNIGSDAGMFAEAYEALEALRAPGSGSF